MLVAAAGLALASIKIKGVGVGIVGVLFAGISAGHFGLRIEQAILEFVREFGLILFVFTIGLQLGPGFFTSFRKQGIKLNLLSLTVIVIGSLLALTLANFTGLNVAAALGLFSGAMTNTPALGAGQQMIRAIGQGTVDPAVAAMAYAIAYPGGVLGVIASLLFVRIVFRINPEKEADEYRLEQRGDVQPLARVNLLVENPRLEGVALAEAISPESEVVVSRIQRAGTSQVEAATETTVLHSGDVILAVGTGKALDRFAKLVGPRSEADLSRVSCRLVSERMAVTNKEVFGKSIAALHLGSQYHATITRITRAGLEISAAPDVRLEFGDVVQVVTDQANLGKVTDLLGNRSAALTETKFLPIFIGIMLGVVLGALPIAVPGMPIPLKMGIAGGPLIVAILLSRVGRIGPLVWYMPLNANLAFRELGICLFLACVGLKAGEKFFGRVLTAEGLHWLLGGLAITIVPLILVGVGARLLLKLNFTALSGLLAGSMTDPPALAFANAICKSDAPSVVYATVYPLTMLLRVVAVQILAIIFLR